MQNLIFKKALALGFFALLLSYPSFLSPLSGDESIEYNESSQKDYNHSYDSRTNKGANIYYAPEGGAPYDENNEEELEELTPEEEYPQSYPAEGDIGVYYYGGVPYRWDGYRWVKWNNRSPVGRTIIRREVIERSQGSTPPRLEGPAATNRQNFRGQVRDNRLNGGVRRSEGNFRNRGSRR